VTATHRYWLLPHHTSRMSATSLASLKGTTCHCFNDGQLRIHTSAHHDSGVHQP
jgi:hypothetical protein